MRFVAARRLAREEGVLAGGSSGTAPVGALLLTEELVRGRAGSEATVVVLPDTGRNCLPKLRDGAWMSARGFLESNGPSTLAEHRQIGDGGAPTSVR